MYIWWCTSFFKMWLILHLQRYHAFDNTRKDTEDNTQVPELMEKVEELITDNQGLFPFLCFLFRNGQQSIISL